MTTVIPNFVGALLGVLTGQSLWLIFLWLKNRRTARREAARKEIQAGFMPGEIERVWCRRCNQEQALKISVNMIVGDVEDGPVGWFTACECEDPMDAVRRHQELMSLLMEQVHEFLGDYLESVKKPDASDTAKALVGHLVARAKENS